MFRNLAFSIAVVGLVAATVAPARSAVITVSGGCTLVDAVSAANADAIVGGCAAGSGADTVVLEHDVTLTAVEEVWMELFGNFNFGASGLPVEEIRKILRQHNRLFEEAVKPAGVTE